jgi:hypothetical protein
MPLFQIACQLHKAARRNEQNSCTSREHSEIWQLDRLTFDRYKAGYYSSRLKRLV